MSQHVVAQQFKAAVEARAAQVAPAGAQAAPGKFDGHRIKAALHGLDGLIQKLEPMILAASPDEYDALVQLAASALHGIAGNDPSPASPATA